MNTKTSKRIRLTASYLILLLAIVIVVYPVLWTVGSSFNPGNSLASSSMIPENASLAHYKDLFAEGSYYLNWYWNTIKVSVLTMVFATIMISLTAYAFSRYRFIGRKNGLIAFLILQMIPQFIAIIAIYVLMSLLRMMDTHLGLILLYTGGLIPMNTWLAKGYFDTIPRELDESARMDGAGHFRIFWQIIMPLAKPILAVVALFSFITPFTEFILASLVLRSPEKMTLSVGLYKLISDPHASKFTEFAAGSVLIAIPISILFLSLQRYFVSGLTAGGTKG